MRKTEPLVFADFQVKNVKHFMGRDVPGYNATLYIRNKRACLCVDDGGGGCPYFTWLDRPPNQGIPPDVAAFLQTDEAGEICEAYWEQPSKGGGFPASFIEKMLAKGLDLESLVEKLLADYSQPTTRTTSARV